MEVLNLFYQVQIFHRPKHPHNVTILSYHYFEHSVSLLTCNLYKSIDFFQILHYFCYFFHFSSLKNGSPPENVTSVNEFFQSLSQFLLPSFQFHCKHSMISDYGNRYNDADSPQKHDCPQPFSIYYTIMNDIHNFHLCFTRSISSLRFALFHFDISPTRYPVMRRILSISFSSSFPQLGHSFPIMP